MVLARAMKETGLQNEILSRGKVLSGARLNPVNMEETSATPRMLSQGRNNIFVRSLGVEEKGRVWLAVLWMLQR